MVHCAARLHVCERHVCAPSSHGRDHHNKKRTKNQEPKDGDGDGLDDDGAVQAFGNVCVLDIVNASDLPSMYGAMSGDISNCVVLQRWGCMMVEMGGVQQSSAASRFRGRPQLKRRPFRRPSRLLVNQSKQLCVRARLVQSSRPWPRALETSVCGGVGREDAHCAPTGTTSH